MNDVMSATPDTAYKAASVSDALVRNGWWLSLMLTMALIPYSCTYRHQPKPPAGILLRPPDFSRLENVPRKPTMVWSKEAI